MNVKIITRHNPSNYGSILQALASTKIIESLGHQCEIIDYQRKDERGIKIVLGALRRKPEWRRNIIKRILYVALRWPIEQFAQYKFDNFRKRLLSMTPRVNNEADLEKIDADVFMTGSDQVWGPLDNAPYDKAYFLDFAKNGKRIGYACSFGHTQFDKWTKEAYASMLERYDHISVRENSALDTIKDLGLGDKTEQVLDPTLLLNHEDWANIFFKDNNITTPSGKYILIYQIHNNPELDKYAKSLSLKLELPLYRMSASFHQIRRGGKFIYLPSPGKFLSLIEHAHLLITDSFHGTAFAINFNTPFVEFLPNNGTSSRNQSILDLTGLKNRIITNHNDFETPSRPIDYSAVNEIINKERMRSINVLKKMIDN